MSPNVFICKVTSNYINEIIKQSLKKTQKYLIICIQVQYLSKST